MKTESQLADTVQEALRLWDAQKAEGLPKETRAKNLEQVLRVAWPKGRESGWKYLCTGCNDYGLVMSECPGDATCGRDKAHLPHEFGTPCWCSLGKRFKKPERGPDDDFTTAGTAKPRHRSFSRMGR